MMKKKNKPIPEAKDAKEVAKKLIRSGAIAAIQVGHAYSTAFISFPN